MKKSITTYQAQMMVVEGIETHASLDSIVKKLSKFDFNHNEDEDKNFTLKQWVIGEMTNILFYPEQHDLKLQMSKAA